MRTSQQLEDRLIDFAVSVIGLADLLRNTNIAVGVTTPALCFFLLACLISLVLSLISSLGLGRISAWAERGQGGH